MNLRDFSSKENKEEDVRETFDKFKDASQDELWTELLRRVNAGKENGTFDKERILSMISVISGNLTTEQKERLTALVNSL